MKKIILFILMIIASVNLFSKELPDNPLFYSRKAYNFYGLVLEDFKYNDNIAEINDGYYFGIFDDELFGHFVYRIREDENGERDIFVIVDEGYVNYLISYKKEAQSVLLFTFCNIRIFNTEDVLLCEVNYYLEEDNVIYECYFDPTIFTYNNKYE